jgi:hypothetical protein
MSITTADGLLAAMANPAKRLALQINKASIATQAAAGYSSLWRATGVPAQGAIPSTAAICNAALTGALNLNMADAAGGESWHIARLALSRSNAGDNIIFADRLAHMGGLSGVTTGNQTVNVAVTDGSLAGRCNQTDYHDVEWYAEIYTDIGTTGQTCTVTYTDAAGNTGNTLTFTLGGASPANQDSRMFALIPANGEFIRSVETVSIGTTTGTAGSWGITALKRLTDETYPVANRMDVSPWDRLGLPPAANDACIMMMQQCITTSTGSAIGNLLLAQG